MYGNKWCIGDQVSVWCEKRAREVKAFFDISTDRCLLQRSAHGFCDTHEPVRKQGEQNRVWGVSRHNFEVLMVVADKEPLCVTPWRTCYKHGQVFRWLSGFLFAIFGSVFGIKLEKKGFHRVYESLLTTRIF